MSEQEHPIKASSKPVIRADMGLVEVEQLWTVKEVALILRLEPETVRNKARKGDLPALRLGRVWRFIPEQIKSWMLHQQEVKIRGDLSKYSESLNE